MPRVVVITTGGTIASRTDPDGDRRPDVRGGELLRDVPTTHDVEVIARDVLCLGSYAMSPLDMQSVLVAVHDALADPAVIGVVVTHGTDTMEETAFLVDLLHDDERPIVFTGAQRPADSDYSDGLSNVRDAIIAAADEQLRGLGVLIVFAGLVLPARGTRKVDTLALRAFAAPSTGPVGQLIEGTVNIFARPVRRPPLDRAALDLGGVRVDIVSLYPGADAAALEAHAARGARGLILEATGLGNSNPTVASAVGALTAADVTLVLSTRVHAGPVLGIYGAGGGRDILAAGAVSAGYLRPSQARILLLALLGTHADRDEICTAFAPAPTADLQGGGARRISPPHRKAFPYG